MGGRMRRDMEGTGRRPLTAQPVGERYAVATRGLHHVQRQSALLGPEADVSDNFVEMDSGCYRRLPTSREER